MYRKSRIEALEKRELLAIDWVNEFGASAFNSNALFSAQEEFLARNIINHAIDDWNRVILDQNYDGDNNPSTGRNFELTIEVFDFATIGQSSSRGDSVVTAVIGNDVPIESTIRLDNDGGSFGWFFDETPEDDIEFTGIADDFQASFVDAVGGGVTNFNDFYRTITHEIGHSLGLYLVDTATEPLLDRLYNLTVDIGDDPVSSNPDDRLRRFGVGPSAVILTTNGGGHVYEGTASNPAHPNQLLNAGRTIPAGQPNVTAPVETTRQFISDLTAQLLADAYGYTVALPSTLDSAHVMLDNITGTLLVQGSARNGTTGVGVTDVITIERVTDTHGDDIRVTVDPVGAEIFTERVPYEKVTQIVVNGNDVSFTNDPINVNANVAQPWTRVAYVVSSNEDVLEDANSVGGANPGNALIDLDQDVPGTQVSLRAAIHESNTLSGDRPIYVGRGIYDLTLSGTGLITQGDLDIISDMTIIGAGAGQTVIDAGGVAGINDRVFEVSTNGVDLSLSQLTLTGGNSSQGGAIFVGAGSSLILDETSLVNNTTTSHGGALRKQGSGTVEIYGSILANNTSGGNGGGIYTDNGSLILGNSIVADNSAGGVEDDIFSISSGFDSYGNNLLTSIRSILSTEIGDEVDNPANLFVVDTVADGVDANDGGTSLREAFVSANAVNGSVWLPPWRHRLTREGAGDLSGDVDLTVAITGHVELVGAGPGLTVIDASGLGERIFDVRSGSLDISRVTLTGGDTTSGANGTSGGAIWVRGGASLALSESAVIGNTAGMYGGGIYNQGTLTVTKSVIANNQAMASGGLHVSMGSTATVGTSIIANNTATSGEQDVFQYSTGGNTLTSTGHNLRTSGSASVFNGTGDHLGTVDHVVTSVIDSFRHADNNTALSVREAVDLTNESANTNEEIWLPAWDFVLTRDRTTFGTGTTDIDASFGDLDVTDKLTVRGINDASSGIQTSVAWRSGVTDAVFDLIGDFTGDGITSPDDGDVDGSDFLTWQLQNGSGTTGSTFEQFSADADDDGDVDQDDNALMWLHYGNWLGIVGVTV